MLLRGQANGARRFLGSGVCVDVASPFAGPENRERSEELMLQ